jgi:hypothetical protein
MANSIKVILALGYYVVAGSNPALRTIKGGYMPKTESKKFVYFCRKYQKIMSKKELRNHKCFHKKKGKRKGKPCSLLVRLPTP